jgi:hypothetical protein
MIFFLYRANIWSPHTELLGLLFRHSLMTQQVSIRPPRWRVDDDVLVIVAPTVIDPHPVPQPLERRPHSQPTMSWDWTWRLLHSVLLIVGLLVAVIGGEVIGALLRGLG